MCCAPWLIIGLAIWFVNYMAKKDLAVHKVEDNWPGPN